MTARQTNSASYDVGYGKPPRHTQFRKGRSGNPGGRPRREPAERLKALTLQEAYRGVVMKREDGVGMPAFAIQAILRSQIELAMSGNVRAQRDILNAVQTYERADAEAAAAEAYVEELVRRAADLEKGLRAAERALPTAEKKMNYIEAARRVRELLGLNKPRSAAESEVAEGKTCAPGEETATEENEAERNAAAPAADRTPRPENDTASAAPPVASSPPFPPALAGEGIEGAADPPAAPLTVPRPGRSPRVRSALHPARESTPSQGADVPAELVHNKLVHNKLLRNKCLRHRTEYSALPFNVTWKEVTSRRGRRTWSGGVSPPWAPQQLPRAGHTAVPASASAPSAAGRRRSMHPWECGLRRQYPEIP